MLNSRELLAATRSPGARYELFSQSNILLELAGGYADIDDRRGFGLATINAYSITKTLTAAAVAELVAAAKLDLDGDVRALLPEYGFSEPFTVRQLLSHRAGLANPLPLAWVHAASQEYDERTFVDDLIVRYRKVVSPPGKRTRYSNIGYLVLGKLIERAAGVPYQSYVETRVVAPVRIRGHLGFTIPDLSQHATGYHPRWSLSHLLIRRLIGDSLMRPVSHDRSLVSFAPTYVNGAAYGGIVANSTGLREYLQAMLRGELSIFDLLRRALAARRQGVIMGWFIGARGGEPYLRHAGGGGGYYSEVRLYPNLGLGSVVVSNFSGFSDRRLLDRLDNVAISAVR